MYMKFKFSKKINNFSYISSLILIFSQSNHLLFTSLQIYCAILNKGICMASL